MNRFTLLLTLIFLWVAPSCKKKQVDDFPLVAFEERVYLNNPSSQDLLVPGGWIYHPGGFGGLVVYRKYINGGNDDFIAHDRSCPTHYNESCRTLNVDGDDLFLECSCNQEKYLLFDGAPGDGATRGTKQYRVVRNGDVLYISN